MKHSPKANAAKSAQRIIIELLETRVVLSASFDVTGLTELRSDPNFSNITGSGVTIAVLDTGIDAKNPDFSGKVLAYYNAVEKAVPTSITSSSVSSAVDNDGHGTHVSGIAASGDSSIGVAYGANLVDVKVIADSGESQLSGDPLLRGLEFVENFASQFNIKVVNMSLGESNQNGGVNDNGIPASDDISRAIQTLESMGITVVAAAGNSYANDPVPGESYPAVVSTISVANIWADNGAGYDFGTYAYGTSYDSWAATETSASPDQFSATSQRSTLSNQVAAPGMDIYSDWNGSSTDNSGSDLLHNTLSGTSMASPFVSGMVALMQQAAMVYGGQYITDPNEILTIIKETSDVIPDPTISGDGRVPIQNGELTGGAKQQLPGTGDTYDRVDVYKAIQEVKALFTGTASNADTNNTIASATVVTSLNGTQSFSESGNIGTDGLNDVGANDVDLYKITLNETGTLSAILADASGGTAFTASLRLFDSNGNQLDIVTGTSSAGYPSLTTANPLAAGTYYIGISSAGNDSYNITDSSNAASGSGTGDYTLTVGISNPDPNGVPQGAVAVDLTNPNFVFQNNEVANEYVGDLGSDPAPDGSTNRVPVPNGDVDMFKIVAPDTGVLTADVDAQAYGFQGADSYVAVFDSNFNQITSNGEPSNFASDSDVQFNVTVGQTYYVAVTADANSGFDPTNPYGRATNSTETDTYYNLYLLFNNGNTDGTALLARQASIGRSINGSISSTNPNLGANGGSKYVDWYSYTANSTGLLNLDAVSNTSGFTPNVQLWTLTSDDSSITEIGAATGSSAPLIYEVVAGQTVYVSVTGAGNSNFNWYSLASGTGGETGSYTLNSTLNSLSSLKTLSDSSVDNGTPQTITIGQTVTGNIGQYNGLIVGDTDVDLYAFTPTTSGSFDIRTDTSQEGSADTLLRLFDANGDQLASNDNSSSATTASFIRYSFVAGQTYYVGVSGSGNSAYNPITGAGATAGSTGTYVLSLTAATEPAISVSAPGSIREPLAGRTATATFTVTLDSASSNTVTVAYATANGSAIAGTDYTAASGTLTFSPGQTSQTVSVQILNDASSDSNTTFSLNLTAPRNAILSVASAQVTITDLAINTLIFNNHQTASFTDANNHHIFVTLVGPGSGQVIFYGSDLNADQITVTGTTGKSSLLIDSTHNQTTTVGNIEVTGNLNSLAASEVTVNGDVVVTGNLTTAFLGGGSGGTFTIDGSSLIRSLVIVQADNFNLTTPAPIRALTAAEWTGTSSITAPSIQTLKVPGNFAAQLVLSDPILSLNSAIFGSLEAGDPWSIAGSVKSISTGSIASGFSATIIGNIANLSVVSNDAGDITAGSITNAKIKGSLSGAAINLTNPTGTDLGSLTAGSINGSQIFSAATIHKVRAIVLNDSEIYAGVVDAVSGLPTSASDFSSDASIESVIITGTRTQYAVTDSDIAAATLGKIVFGSVNIDNSGTPFGLSTDQLSSFSRIIANRHLSWKSSQGLANLTDNGDLTENIFA